MKRVRPVSSTEDPAIQKLSQRLVWWLVVLVALPLVLFAWWTYLQFPSRLALLTRVDRVEGWEHVEAGLANGKGIILVTGHLGNWEFGGAYFAARGVPIDVVARGMANPIFEAYVSRTRRKIGMEVIHDKDAVRRTPRSDLEDNSY